MVINSSRKKKPLPEITLPSEAPAVAAVKLTAAEKKKAELAYQQKIKEALTGLAPKSQKAKALATVKTAAPAVAATISRSLTEPAPKSSTVDFKAIREKVLQEISSLNNEEEKTTKLAEVRERIVPKIFKKKPVAVKREATGLPKEVVVLPNSKRKKAAPEEPEIILNQEPKSKLGRHLASLVLFFLLLVILILGGIYLGGWRGPWVSRLALAAHLPGLFVNGRILPLIDFFEDTEALAKYWDRSELSFTKEQLQEQVLKSWVEKEVIKQLAQAKGLALTEAEISQQLDFVLTNSGSSLELENLIGSLYGWSLAEYTDKIIKPLLLAQKLENDFYQSAGRAAAQAQLAKLRDQILDEEIEFKKAAPEINEDASKFTEGDLGWFALGEIAPELELAALSLEAGALSPVLESRFGYHVLKLEEKVVNQATSQTTFHLSHLFKAKPSFNDYLNEQIKKAKVLTLIKI